MKNLIKFLLRLFKIENIGIIGDDAKVEGGINFHNYHFYLIEPSIQEVRTELDKEFVSEKEKAVEEYEIGDSPKQVVINSVHCILI